jgi:hypothetical protein
MDLSKKNARPQAKLSKWYTVPIGNGLFLAYRRGKKGGTWTAKRKLAGEGFKYAYERLGDADDTEWSQSFNVLSYDQAIEKARAWEKGKAQEYSGEVHSGSYSVADCLRDYVSDLTKKRRKPQYRTQVSIDAFILPSLGSIQLAKPTHPKGRQWRDTLAESAPPYAHQTGQAASGKQMKSSKYSSVKGQGAHVADRK